VSLAPLRVVIADDEQLALERLMLAFRHVPGTEVVGSAANGLEAIDRIAELKPDIAVLDIQMPGRSGLGVAAALDAELRPDIIFLTAFDCHAVDAFDLEAADYLLKPLRLDRLRQAIERVRRRRSQRLREPAATPAEGPGGHGFWVQGRHGLCLVPIDEVEWVEAAKDYVLLHTRSRSHIIRSTMTAVEQQFGPETLLRVHRSAMVRPGTVKRLQLTSSGGGALVLSDEVAVQVGPSYLPEVRARFA